MRKLHLAALVSSAIALAPSSAHALTFDPDGVASFAPNAVVAEGFEGATLPTGMTRVEGPDAIEGKSYASVVVTQAPASIVLKLPAEERSYHARMYARGNRVVADVSVDYPDDGGSPSFSARFFPTGRVTSDGWYEVATAPFSIDGTRTPSVSFTVFASGTRADGKAQGADIDALEITSEGTFHRPSTCSLPRDPACGVGEFCAAGWCRNGTLNVPPLPDAKWKDDVVSYFEQRLQIFFGGRFSRAENLPRAIAAMEQMRVAEDAWSFWNGFVTGMHRLRDWHTTLDGPVGVAGRGAFPICVVEGDADLTHGVVAKDPNYPDVIVSHVGPDQNSGLKPGDRIVAVNGMHPIAFAESLDDLDWGFWHADDPAVHAEAMERLRNLIRRWGKTITWIKCDPVSLACAPPETLDVNSLPTTEPQMYPSCDHRPGYHLESGNPDATTHFVNGVYHGRLKGSPAGEDLYGMIWNSVYLDGSGTNAYQPAIEEFRANAKGVILDHRLGDGGTEPAAEYLTTLFRKKAKLGAATGYLQTLGLFDTLDNQTALKIFDARAASQDAYDVGADDARTDLKTALLIARDGSASDWFPYGMQNLPNVRIFGRRTAGAFSSYIQFDYFGQIDWRMASGDLVRDDDPYVGQTHLGSGVLPTEEILPKQSDLLQGRDTVYERALAWLRGAP